MKLILRYVDAAFCLLLAFMVYQVFPLGRLFDESMVFAVLLVVFYFASYAMIRNVIVPVFFRGGWWSLGAFAVFVLMFLLLFVLISSDPETPNQLFPPLTNDPKKLTMCRQRCWLLFLVVQAFGLSVGILSRLARERIRLLSAERDRDHAALLLYRAQLNPHFLYNTLNSLYALIVSGSDKAEQVLMQVVDMARATSQITQHEFVSIDDEVTYIRNYIELQRLRMERPERIRFQYHRYCDVQVAPMLLTSFVGNALKYGTRDESQGNIDIVLSVDEQARLTLDIANPVPSSCSDDTDREAGTGIANSRRRLALLYPERHVLDIGQRDGLYKVHLEMSLDAEQQKCSRNNHSPNFNRHDTN